jgi:nicotinamide-nucleotide amidase
VTLRLSIFQEDGANAREKLEEVERIIQHKIRPFIYSREEKSIEEVIIELMQTRGKKLAVAESCTGGMIASRLVGVPGASNVFDRGFITYSNQAKHELLDVSQITLKKFGAVCEETAIEMAAGARVHSGADYAVSVTGIAGPDGGSTEKPVGLVYIGLATPETATAERFLFAGDRDANRRRATLAALSIIYRHLTQG